MKTGTLASLAALVLTAAVSCERYPADLSHEIRFVATQAGDTRTSFTAPDGDSYPVVWTADDKSVQISLDSATPVEASVRRSADGRTARFTATFSGIGSGSHRFYALSPASAFDGISDGRWSYSVPWEQTPTASSVDPAAMVLSAEASTDGLPDEVPLSFTHLTAYGCFSLQGIRADIRSVTLDFGGGDALTLHTSASGNIWFGIRPRDVSGQSVTLRVKAFEGSYSKDFTFPEGKAFEAGKIARFTMDMSGAAFEPDDRSISILAIGNSFSVDAMQYLYGYLKQAGYENIFLGNLYIGGCTLEKHASNLASGSKTYTYYTNSTGTWSSTGNFDAMSAIRSRNWDFISMQQASGWSGMPDSYEPYLSAVVDSVKANCPGAKRMWHMTWAYQKNSGHSDFTKYGCVQIRMYDAIVGTVRTKVLGRGDFDFVIPCGTAIQNLRTSFIGDSVTRDGYHMSYDIGRAATALMWLRQISGRSVDGIDIKPSGYSLTARQTAAIKEAVEKAYAHPWEVTASNDPPESLAHESDPALRQALADEGYDPTAYVDMPYGITTYAFYNSTSSTIFFAKANGRTESNLDEFAATPLFSREDIPVGSILVLKNGYQYRPEAWTRLSSTNSSANRPGNVNGPSVFVVTEDWWQGKAYRAFNLAEDGNPHLTEEKMNALRSCFAIFVPIN